MRSKGVENFLCASRPDARSQGKKSCKGTCNINGHVSILGVGLSENSRICIVGEAI